MDLLVERARTGDAAALEELLASVAPSVGALGELSGRRCALVAEARRGSRSTRLQADGGASRHLPGVRGRVRRAPEGPARVPELGEPRGPPRGAATREGRRPGLGRTGE